MTRDKLDDIWTRALDNAWNRKDAPCRGKAEAPPEVRGVTQPPHVIAAHMGISGGVLSRKVVRLSDLTIDELAAGNAWGKPSWLKGPVIEAIRTVLGNVPLCCRALDPKDLPLAVEAALWPGATVLAHADKGRVVVFDVRDPSPPKLAATVRDFARVATKGTPPITAIDVVENPMNDRELISTALRLGNLGAKQNAGKVLSDAEAKDYAESYRRIWQAIPGGGHGPSSSRFRTTMSVLREALSAGDDRRAHHALERVRALSNGDDIPDYQE